MLSELTPRQTEVMELMATGASTAHISQTLNISNATTRNHIQAILTALGANTRLEAVHEWRTISEPANMIIEYCHRARIVLTQQQKSAIHEVFELSANASRGDQVQRRA